MNIETEWQPLNIKKDTASPNNQHSGCLGRWSYTSSGDEFDCYYSMSCEYCMYGHGEIDPEEYEMDQD